VLKKELLDFLACPKCTGDLEYRPKEDELICHACRLRFPIIDDIPVLLLEEAKPIAKKS
jgi:uncharacterized protein YbaR (Trm112 family)